MAGLYDDRIVGLKEQKEFARRLREQQQEPAGQMVSGWYVPNTGGAVVNALRNVLGAYQERQADEELKGVERERAKDIANVYAQMGVQAPESLLRQAGTEEIKPGMIDRFTALLRGEEAKGTPAQPYQPPALAQNVSPEQNRNALLNLINIAPEHAQNMLALQKLQAEEARDLRKQQMEKVPTGFMPNSQGQIVPMQIPGYGNYAQYELAKAREKENIISPVEAQNMANQQARLALDIKSSQRAEESAKRTEDIVNQQKALKQWEFENPNANKNLAEIQSAQAANEKLQTSLQNYRDALSKASTEDILDPRKNAELQSIYQSATWPLRDETLMNTGVLNPGEMPMLNKALTDPSSVMGMVRGKEELLNQIDQVMNVSKNNAKAIAKSRLPSAPPGMEQTPYWTNLKRFAEGAEQAKPTTIPSQSDIEAEINRRKGK